MDIFIIDGQHLANTAVLELKMQGEMPFPELPVTLSRNKVYHIHIHRLKLDA